MRRHLFELMICYALEVLKSEGNSVDGLETKLCGGRSGVGFARRSKPPVQPTQPPIHGALLSPSLRRAERETDHCHNPLTRLGMSGAIPILPYAFIMFTVNNQMT
jgi:hypothetical protein